MSSSEPLASSLSNPVGKALWFIESHYADNISPDQMALVGGVSRYHLTRAFSYAIGLSPMRYLRARRLTEAARRLAGGAPDILALALDAGYGSHEAFTRAFRDQFGLTPEAVRTQRHVDNLTLMEPIRMDKIKETRLAKPRLVVAGPMLVAGIGVRYNCDDLAGIPGQWQRFLPHMYQIGNRVDGKALGVCCNTDEAGNMDYLCGVQVKDFNGIPADWSRLRLSEQEYAVFAHPGHVSELRNTFNAIFNQWQPTCGRIIADAPEFELYGEDFNGVTGLGGMEVWVPLRR